MTCDARAHRQELFGRKHQHVDPVTTLRHLVHVEHVIAVVIITRCCGDAIDGLGTCRKCAAHVTDMLAVMTLPLYMSATTDPKIRLDLINTWVQNEVQSCLQEIFYLCVTKNLNITSCFFFTSVQHCHFMKATVFF